MVIEPKNIIDESTTEKFRFVFLCDSCGKTIFTYDVPSVNSYKVKLFSHLQEQKTNEEIWIKEHDEALFIAKMKALDFLNRCEICGKLVCDECIVESENLNGGICCRKCSKHSY